MGQLRQRIQPDDEDVHPAGQYYISCGMSQLMRVLRRATLFLPNSSAERSPWVFPSLSTLASNSVFHARAHGTDFEPCTARDARMINKGNLIMHPKQTPDYVNTHQNEQTPNIRNPAQSENRPKASGRQAPRQDTLPTCSCYPLPTQGTKAATIILKMCPTSGARRSAGPVRWKAKHFENTTISQRKILLFLPRSLLSQHTDTIPV